MRRQVMATPNDDTLRAIQTAVATAIAAERRRFVTLARATCACQRCKDDVAALLLAEEGN